MSESIARICESVKTLFCPLSRLTVNKSGKELNAYETGREIVATSTSLVMATVMAKDWKSTYGHNTACLIAKAYADGVGAVVLLAVAGGPACQEELAVVRAVIEVMGGAPGMVGENEGSIGKKWTWQIKRKGFKNIYISLRVYHKAESVALGLEKTVHPYNDMGKPGNKRRLAVLSCPLEDAEGRNANIIVNEKIAIKLAAMVARCKSKGFAPKWDDGHDEWRAFFK